MKSVSFCMILAALLAQSLVCRAAPESYVMERDGVRVAVGQGAWPDIVVDGALFSKASQFWVVNPKWTEHWYSYDRDSTLPQRLRKETAPNGAQRVWFTMSAPGGEFDATQTIELKQGRRLRIAVDARLTSDIGAVMEHEIGNIVPGWLTGRPYEWTDNNGKTTRRIVAAEAPAYDTKRCKMISGFRSFVFDSRAGRVEIRSASTPSGQTTGTAPLTLLDYRKNKYAMGNMTFWFGVFDIPIKRGQTVSYELEFIFPPRMPAAKSQDAALTTKPQQTDAALRSEVVPDRIIPTPKKLSWKKGNLPLTEGMPVVVSAPAGEGRSFARELAGELSRGIFERTGVRLKPEDQGGGDGIIMTLRDGAASGGLRPEAYQILIGDNPPRRTLTADTTEGLVNAVKTLKQLLREDNGKWSLRKCRIDDYPAQGFRGILYFTGKNALDVQLKLLRDILGPLKINQLVYHCSLVNWASHPELHSPALGMSLEDARAVAAEAKRQHITVTPFVPAYGLKEWLRFGGLKHPNAGKPKLDDPFGAEETKTLKDIMREAAAVFPSPWFHIGHDELETSTPALLASVRNWRDFLAGMGRRTMIWSDLFLWGGESTDAMNAPSAGEARARREGLPKDVIVCDWHYASAAPPKYTSLKIFNDAGLDTLACPWFEPENILSFAKAATLQMEKPARADAGARRGKTLGLLDTTWAGWNYDRRALEENACQAAAYVLAAEAAWTGGTANPLSVPFDYFAEFIRMWTEDVLPRGGAKGWVVNLSEAAKFPLRSGGKDRSASTPSGWLGYRTGDDLREFPVGRQWLGRFLFDLPGEKDNPRAVLLSAMFNPEGAWPSKLVIPVETTASAVTFAIAATVTGPGDPPVAETVVSYDDGSTAGIAWRLGQNIFPLDDPRITAAAPIIWQRGGANRAPFRVHSFTWINPAPGKVIRSMVFKSADKGSGVLLFGISGIHGEHGQPRTTTDKERGG
ncbi:MAG: glycoside hydrolase family 20 zincin-like fold domain-containing protein, partial [bacterium]